MTETLRFPRAGAGGTPSPPDLVRECGRRMTDPSIWKEFQAQFHQLILRSITRIMWNRYRKDCLEEACDIAQDVYLRLVKNNGRLLRSFKGETDLSARAFLSMVAVSVVSNHFRSQRAEKKQPAEIISIEDVRQQNRNLPDEASDFDIASILSWIDVERLMESESDHRNAARNVLICKLHYVDQLTVSEIAEFPVFGLNRSAIGTVIQNMREHLRKRMGR